MPNTKKKPAGKKSASESVRDELLRITNLKQEDGESDADLATRICEKVNKLDDDVYDTLSKGAVDWNVDAVKAINASKVPPKFSDYPKAEKKQKAEVQEPAKEEGSQAEQEDSSNPTTTTEEGEAKVQTQTASNTKRKSAPPPKKSNAKASAKKPAKAKAAAPKKEKGPKSESMADRVRRIVVAKPDSSFEDVVKKLGEKHDVGGHAWNIYNHAKRVMEIVSER